MRLIVLVSLAAVTSFGAYGADVPITPGLWEVTATIESVDMPGAPPQMLQAMKGQPTVIKSCLTEADAKKGPQELLKQNGCTSTNYAMQDGKFSAEMKCKQPQGEMTGSVTGTFTPTSYSTRSQMVMTGATSMKMEVVANAKLLGPCP